MRSEMSCSSLRDVNFKYDARASSQLAGGRVCIYVFIYIGARGNLISPRCAEICRLDAKLRESG